MLLYTYIYILSDICSIYSAVNEPDKDEIMIILIERCQLSKVILMPTTERQLVVAVGWMSTVSGLNLQKQKS